MSPYATTLAQARLDALRKLIAALNEADTPEEKRRCAVAILSAPDPCDLDDEIELADEGDEEQEENDQDHANDDSSVEEEPEAIGDSDDDDATDSDPDEVSQSESVEDALAACTSPSDLHHRAAPS